MNSNYLFQQRLYGNQTQRMRNNDENLNKTFGNKSIINEDNITREFGKDITNTVNDNTQTFYSRKSMDNKENNYKQPNLNKHVYYI